MQRRKLALYVKSYFFPPVNMPVLEKSFCEAGQFSWKTQQKRPITLTKSFAEVVFQSKIYKYYINTRGVIELRCWG